MFVFVPTFVGDAKIILRYDFVAPLTMKNFNIIGVHWKIQFLGGGGGVMKNQYRGGSYLKRGAWTICRFKGAWQEREVGVFDGGWYPNAHYGLYQIV